MPVFVWEHPQLLLDGGAVAWPIPIAFPIFRHLWCKLIIFAHYLMGLFISPRHEARDLVSLHLVVLEGMFKAEPGDLLVAKIRFKL